MTEEVKACMEKQKAQMEAALQYLEKELGRIRAGKASPQMLEGIRVDYYGNMTPLDQVGAINTPDARQIVVQPWEKKMVNVIEKAIRESDLGLNPSSVGDIIRVPTPPLTEERRKEMVKLVKTEGEDAKVAVRNIRRDANESLKKMVKEKECSEDDERRAQDDIQKLTDKFVQQIDKLLIEKEKEVMTV